MRNVNVSRTDIFPNNGCLCLRLKCTKMSLPISGWAVIFFSYRSAWKHKLEGEDFMYLLPFSVDILLPVKFRCILGP